MIEQAHHPKNSGKLPDGFRTARVQHSLDDLRDQLRALIELIDQVKQDVPDPEGTLAVETLIATDTVDQHGIPDGGGILSIIGSGFDPSTEVDINSPVAIVATPTGTGSHTEFYSSERIDVVVDPSSASWPGLQSGSHTITAKNPNGETITVTLPNGLAAGPNGIVFTTSLSRHIRKIGTSGSQKRATPRRRTLQYSVFGKPVGGALERQPASPVPAGHLRLRRVGQVPLRVQQLRAAQQPRLLRPLAAAPRYQRRPVRQRRRQHPLRPEVPVGQQPQE